MQFALAKGTTLKQPWPYKTVNCWKQDHAVLALYAKSLGIPMAELMHRYALGVLNGTQTEQ